MTAVGATDPLPTRHLQRRIGTQANHDDQGSNRSARAHYAQRIVCPRKSVQARCIQSGQSGRIQGRRPESMASNARGDSPRHRYGAWWEHPETSWTPLTGSASATLRAPSGRKSPPVPSAARIDGIGPRSTGQPRKRRKHVLDHRLPPRIRPYEQPVRHPDHHSAATLISHPGACAAPRRAGDRIPTRTDPERRSRRRRLPRPRPSSSARTWRSGSGRCRR